MSNIFTNAQKKAHFLLYFHYKVWKIVWKVWKPGDLNRGDRMTGTICAIKKETNTNKFIVVLLTSSGYVPCIVHRLNSSYIIGRKVTIEGVTINNNIFISSQ